MTFAEGDYFAVVLKTGSPRHRLGMAGLTDTKRRLESIKIKSLYGVFQTNIFEPSSKCSVNLFLGKKNDENKINVVFV